MFLTLSIDNTEVLKSSVRKCNRNTIDIHILHFNLFNRNIDDTFISLLVNRNFLYIIKQIVYY